MRVAIFALLLSSAAATDANPLQKVFQLMDELTAKIQKDGEVEAKAYAEFVEWCDDTSKNAGFEIKTLTSKKEKLEATIEKSADDSSAATAKIEDLAASIATDEKDLKAATEIRNKENADFKASEAELAE